MAKLLKLRRGTTSEHSSFTGAEGEVTVDTTKDTVVVHDGSTAGGTPLAKESDVTAIPAVIDEDNMASNSATRPPSQQSVKAYVDAVPAVIDEDNMASDSATRPPSQQSAKAYTDNVGNGIMTSVALRAPINNPTLTGTVTVPTASANDNTTKAASTAYVQTELGDYAPLVSPTFTGTPTVPGYAPLASPALTGTATGVNLTLSGNLTVNGTTTTVATTNTTLTDNLIELNSGASSNANDAGILIERGSTGDNAIIAWDESADKFTVGTTTGTASSTGDISITTGTLVANIEGNVTGSGANLTSLPAAQVSGTLGSCNASNLTSIPAGQLTGTLPAISGANLTNLPGGGGEISISTGSASVGDRMGINSSGNAVKLGSSISANNPPTQQTNGYRSSSNGEQAQWVYMPALKVYVAFYQYSSSSCEARVFKYSGGVFTQGNHSTETVTGTSGFKFSCCRISDTQIMYVYTDGSRMYPRVLTLTATSNNVGYELSGGSNSRTDNSNFGTHWLTYQTSASNMTNYYGRNERFQLHYVEDYKVAVVFQGDSNYAQAGIVTWNSTGTNWTISAVATNLYAVGVNQSMNSILIDSNKIVATIDNAANARIVAASISGTNIYVGGNHNLDSAGSGSYNHLVWCPDIQRILYVWYTSSGSKYALLSISGNTLTVQKYATSFGSYYQTTLCYIKNIGRVFVSFVAQSGSNDMRTVEVNSSSITSYSEGNGFGSSNPNVQPGDGDTGSSGLVFDEDSGHILRAWTYNSDFYYDSYDCGSGTPVASSYIGCYKESGKVYVSGGVATGLSGLTPGLAYYVDDMGTLSTDSTKQLAGVAKTSTTMLVR